LGHQCNSFADHGGDRDEFTIGGGCRPASCTTIPYPTAGSGLGRAKKAKEEAAKFFVCIHE
jgi:hypothetical protein